VVGLLPLQGCGCCLWCLLSLGTNTTNTFFSFTHRWMIVDFDPADDRRRIEL